MQSNLAYSEDSYFNVQEKRMLKELLPNHGLSFSRYFFKERENEKFIVSDHHKVISRTLQKVFDGLITRLIINIPPSYTKTEEAVIHFMARGLARNPKAKFLHTSYSQDLALLNSQTCRDVIESEKYQELFPMQIRDDSSAKKRWWTKAGGGVYAVSTGGAMTGFRAGRMGEEFNGAIIIDDPVKPDDAYSDVKRQKINNRFNNTIKSRLASEKVPIIIIMQRIHENDLSGFLLEGGSGEMWHHLLLPAEIPEKKIKEWYPKNYKYGIPLHYKLPQGALWKAKHTDSQLAIMKIADPYTHASQYLQQPSPIGGSVFKDQFWRLFTALPSDASYMRIYGDTAQEINEHNDYSVFQAWVFSPSKGIFLVDQVRDKWESPELKVNCVAFWNKQKEFCRKNNLVLQVLNIEKKSSGSGLFQTIQRESLIPVGGIDRTRGKVPRAFDTVPQISSGNVHINERAEWLFDYLDEFRKFTPLMNHSFDDQIDPTMDAVADMLNNIQTTGEISITGK